MSGTVDEAVKVNCPTTNKLISCIAGSLSVSADLDLGAGINGWVRFEAYGADFGFAFWAGADGAASDTQPGGKALGALTLTATAVPGAGVADTRCQFVVPAGGYRDFFVNANARYYRVIASAAAGTCRITRV